MEVNNYLIDLLNCVSWSTLTIALIIGLVFVVKGHYEVKMAIKNKIEKETEILK